MVFSTHNNTKTLEETEQLGIQLSAYFLEERKSSAWNKRAFIICLYGDLGSGKTSLVRSMITAFGHSSRVLSPTFSLMREYPLQNNLLLYHIDLYRLETMEKETSLGLDDIFSNPNAFVCIEWADRLKEALPLPRIDIVCSVLPDDSHTYDIIRKI